MYCREYTRRNGAVHVRRQYGRYNPGADGHDEFFAVSFEQSARRRHPLGVTLAPRVGARRREGARECQLDSVRHEAYPVVRVPRAASALHGVHLVSVPWPRPGGGFTLLIEAAMLIFAAQVPIAPLAKMAEADDTRTWAEGEQQVGTDLAKLDFSGVAGISYKETSVCRGQNYMAILVDLGQAGSSLPTRATTPAPRRGSPRPGGPRWTTWGPAGYGVLLHEPSAHRRSRQAPREAGYRRHTAWGLVEAFPVGVLRLRCCELRS